MALLPYPTVDTFHSKRIPNPARPLDEGVQLNNLLISFDSGAEERRKRGKARRTWELTYPALYSDAYQTLYNFFIACSGSIVPFTWIHPETKVVYNVRFNSDNFTAKCIGKNRKGSIWTLGLKIIEVI
jgi:hypothetical protein